ncbi:DUF1499 domain-containing protein [Alishewanella sp. 16-MA]|uniref:DUF1499 domain-containing protein n=1 Tax=Alishewanella maricola TaxID=2795740 RepID=A0ABS8C117_9ALTE|nr:MULTISPECIES: DUF1499 domain-containing protein [Alishewanella]MDP4946543.1 DUF1499 domain-containing protein [Alishewanella sp.]MCB5225825.1 DUF1499 domain-containing protein [Alishewanella maricola]MDP5036660.1 DUF1499 domain-containing protein [Alishewanella sp.]MDP5187604.1 DUF1499 domain-containing protein [Alishewanella sp.]MDP5458251.1 DUF1499 domain-containing protein [Alishewanella sp. SMS8]
MNILVILVSFVAFLMVVLPGLLYKYGLFALSTAFAGLRYGVYVGGAALVLLLVYLVLKRKNSNWGLAAASALLAIFAVAVPVSLLNKARSVPPIHDISTDLVNPPEFIAIAPLRADAPNPVAYAGEETAEQQRVAYPELATQQYSQSLEQVFAAAEAAVKSYGMEIVNVDRAAGIIEATHTTAWFGFKDDVIIRVVDNGEMRLLDIRSKSRVGRSDVGKNAERINSLISSINSAL